MKNLFHILVLSLMVMPMAANALIFEKPDRALTPAEIKIGSIYRGCIGFHCLEEASYLEVSLEVDADLPAGALAKEGGEVKLTVGTNAREGVVVLMSTSVPTNTCLEEVSGGMEGMKVFKKGCAEITGQVSIMRTTDQAEEAFGRLSFTSASNIKLLSVIAY